LATTVTGILGDNNAVNAYEPFKCHLYECFGTKKMIGVTFKKGIYACKVLFLKPPVRATLCTLP